MIYEELLRECAIAIEDMKLTPRREQKSGKDGDGEIIRFYDERGHELCVYVDVDAKCRSLLDALVVYYDCEETTTKAGDLFRFTKNLETAKIETYVRFCNILWAHRYQFKTTLPKGTPKFHDEDLLVLILELQHRKISHALQVVNQRPRVSFTHNDEEIASARKSVGRLRYQDTAGKVHSCKGNDGEPLKEFISMIVDDVLPKISEIKKIR